MKICKIYARDFRIQTTYLLFAGLGPKLTDEVAGITIVAALPISGRRNVYYNDKDEGPQSDPQLAAALLARKFLPSQPVPATEIGQAGYGDEAQTGRQLE